MKIQTISADKAADKFAFLNFNRPVSPQAVRALRESVEKHGIIRPVTVIATSAIEGKRGWYVGDGQHLFTALVQDELDIPYVTLEIDELEDIYGVIVELNTTAKSWQTHDYVRIWAASGKEEYLKLQELKLKTDLSYAQLAVLLTGNRRSTRDIQHGSFKFFRKTWGLKMVREVEELRTMMFMNSDIALGYYNFRLHMDKKTKDKYDVQNFIAKLSHAKVDVTSKIGNSSFVKWEETFENVWSL